MVNREQKVSGDMVPAIGVMGKQRGNVMIRLFDEKKKRTPESVEEEFKNCKYILLDFGDLQEPEGYLDSVSESADSFDEISERAYQYSRQGVKCILLGSYNNGGGIGVQYEIK
ncbi:MAG: hypothetical protein IK115_04725 [Lachnospiraceae bacterium]|nr:hypothetical protein [Lachnospiraceae bacterium]